MTWSRLDLSDRESLACDLPGGLAPRQASLPIFPSRSPQVFPDSSSISRASSDLRPSPLPSPILQAKPGLGAHALQLGGGPPACYIFTPRVICDCQSSGPSSDRSRAHSLGVSQWSVS